MYAGPSCVLVASVSVVAPVGSGSETGSCVGVVDSPLGEGIAEGEAVGVRTTEADGAGAETPPEQLESVIDQTSASTARRLTLGRYGTTPTAGHRGKHLNITDRDRDGSLPPLPRRRPWLATGSRAFQECARHALRWSARSSPTDPRSHGCSVPALSASPPLVLAG